MNLAEAILSAARGELPERIPLVAVARYTAAGEVRLEPLEGAGAWRQ
jgi:hypothetical protein